MQIRRVRRDEARRLRQIRLRALAEARYAFDSAIADEVNLPAQVWERRAETGAAAETAVTLFAEDQGDCVGLVTGLLGVDGPGTAEIVSMWVDPRTRSQGVGKRLLDTVIGWARERGVRQVMLWVTETNDSARTLYEKAGFTPTGVREPLESDSSLMGVRLSLRLDE
jgi:ribosomal protein S18 acetylase RimI-like enzyme